MRAAGTYISADIQLVNLHDPFGDARSGSLRLVGKLAPINFRLYAPLQEEIPLYRQEIRIAAVPMGQRIVTPL